MRDRGEDIPKQKHHGPDGDARKEKKRKILGMPTQKQDLEEELLEKFVLGGQQSFVKNLKSREDEVNL